MDNAPAMRSTISSLSPSSAVTDSMNIFGFASVPTRLNTTVSTSSRARSVSPSRTRMPLRAADSTPNRRARAGDRASAGGATPDSTAKAVRNAAL